MANMMTLPAEWARQSAIQLTWPHAGTDWNDCLGDINATYIEMARAITDDETLLVVTPDTAAVRDMLAASLTERQMKNIRFHQCDTNDTWARDHGFITLSDGKSNKLLDFRFNGWGEKFAADKDNAINSSLYNAEICRGEYADLGHFVLEGGSIESDGNGTVFTTTGCLTAPHRNQPMTREDIEASLKDFLNVQRVLWIDYGHLEGDDTDGHIDTIVRTAPDNTLVYVGCDDKEDSHYGDLRMMEEQLKTFRTTDGKPYRLLRLPMPDAIYDGDDRLPATYANFVITNNTVIYPTYAQPDKDDEAHRVLAKAFPGYGLTGIDSRTVVRQHGSLHCCTMQYPYGVIDNGE